MCYLCHYKLSNETITKQLLEALIKKNFHEWNTKTINHLIIISSGINGNNNKKIAIILLNQYINNFLQYQSDNYIPENSIEKMYSIDKLKSGLNYIKKNHFINN